MTASAVQLLSLACFKARLHIPGSSAGSLLDLRSCRHGWEMRCVGWKHLKPEVLANQLWGFSTSSSPTRCMRMQVPSLIPDSSVCGKHDFLLPSSGEGPTDMHTQSHRPRGCMRWLEQLSLLRCVHPSQTQVVTYAWGLWQAGQGQRKQGLVLVLSILCAGAAGSVRESYHLLFPCKDVAAPS